jgi:subtilisin family serine protease
MGKTFLLFVVIPAIVFGQHKLLLQQQDIINIDGKLSDKILSGRLIEEFSIKTYADKNKGLLKQKNISIENENTMRIVVYFENYPGLAELNGLESLGVKYFPGTWTPPLPDHPYGFMLAEVPVNNFLPVLELDFVKKMSTAGSVNYANNNEAVRKIRADSSWIAGWTGNGVKVAILDSGLDTEPLNNDLPSVIEKRDYSNYPSSVDNGVENTVTSHGTHVTGSVLGRGVMSAANTGNSGGAYKGSAPEADLVFLKIGSDNDGYASGEAMIAAMHAAADTFNAGILSMSYGGWYDHHDGSSAEEQTVDWVYSKGKPFFISAGNEADNNRHYSGTVAANSSTDYIPVKVLSPDGTTELFFNLVWDDGDARKNLSLQYYNPSKVLKSSSTYQTTQSVRGTESKYSFMNGYPAATSGSYTYYLKVVNPSSTAQKFHIYEVPNYGYVTFVNPDSNYTIGQPATADNAFSVGAYVSRQEWKASNGNIYRYDPVQILNNIASFSGRGPRIDETPMPFITAPGSAIISLADRDVAPDYNEFYIDSDGLTSTGAADYAVMQGTSMATPVAAGAAALILQKYPSAAPGEIYTAIKNSAISDSYTGTLPNNTWGNGRLDIYNAIKYIDGEVPVELITFTGFANKTGINLTWETASEVNNYGFEIQRSVLPETGEWQKAGFVTGHGTTTSKNSYHFSDNYNAGLSKIYYRLKQIDFDGTAEYSNVIEVTALPAAFALEQNYPNPFNPSTAIRFSLPEDSRVKISVYNIMGEKAAELLNGIHAAGYDEIMFNASSLASGVYYYRIEAAGINTGTEFSSVKKMMVIK